MQACTPVPAVGVVCLRGGPGAWEVLLVRRGRAPRRGEWGESVEAAALRELGEETGVTAELAGLIEVVDGFFPGEGGEPDRHYVLIDFAARWVSGDPVAGDDAAEAAFHPLEVIDALVDWSETRRIIRAAAQRLTTV